MNDCVISVIVAVFNREKLLDRCLESLVFQRFDENYEIILVDDQSTDCSWSVMEWWRDRFSEKVRIFRNESKGVARAKNLGIKNARGRYVMFVDSDDYVSYDAMSDLYSGVADGEAEIVATPIYRIGEGKKTKLGALASSSAD